MSIQAAFLEFTERDLAYHMVIEHTLFFFLGVLSVQVAEIILKLLVSSDSKRKTDLKGTLILFWTRFLRTIFSVNRYGYVWIIMAVALFAFWHIPSVFDFAQLHEQVHIAQHISFVVVGAVSFLAVRSLGESFKLFALFALNGIMGLAGLMFSVLDKPVYLVYSINSHNNTGTWMLIMCIVLLVIVLPFYLIKRALFYARIGQGLRIVSYAILLELSFILPIFMCEVKHKAMLEDEFIAVAPNNILGNSVIAPMFFRR